jgi:hypothetical protein
MMSASKWKPKKQETWEVRKARRREQVASPKELMLRDLLKATTPQEKRKVIESFSPYHFAFGYELDPRNPYEQENQDERL